VGWEVQSGPTCQKSKNNEKRSINIVNQKSISPCTAMGIEVYAKQDSVLFVNKVRTVTRQEKQLKNNMFISREKIR
jgi:hypothetical protein